MSLNITFLGHSGFLLRTESHAVAIDPFLTGNPVATAKPEDIECDYIAITHGHNDHVGDMVSIARANNATVVAAFEICNMATDEGVTHVEPGNPGGRINTPFGYVAFTQAFHSSSYNGTYMGMLAAVDRRIGQFLGDAEQLVVLRVAVAAAGGAGLDLAAVGGHGDVGDRRVLRLARSVAQDGGVACCGGPGSRCRRSRSACRSG
jgi:hypothetical protein